jgi:hypothetical protein
MAEQAYAYVTLIPVAQGFQSAVAKELGGVGGLGANAGEDLGNQMGGKFKSTFATFAKGAVIALGVMAGLAVKDFFSDAVTSASDFAEQGAAVGQVFGDAGGDIQKFASTGATALGQSKVQILEAAKQFGIYGKAAGLAGKDNANFSTNLVSLATDLASFNNTSVDDALMALGAGLRGESEPLRKYGVLITETAMKNKGMELGIGTMTKTAKGFTYTMTEQEKIIARNALVFEQTATQQGDFARTSEGLANQQRILAAQTENFGIQVGTALLPTLTNLASFANTVLLPAFGAIGKFFADYGPVIGAFAATVGILTVALNLQAIATGLASAAQWVMNAALLANPMTWVVLAVAALVAGIVLLATKTTIFQDIWTAMTSFVTTAWNAVVGFFSTTFTNIGKWFSNLWTGATNAWNTFSGFIQKGVQAIGDFFKPVFEGIGTLFKGYINTWLTIFESFINFFVNGINGIIGGINAVLTGIKVATGGTINLSVGKIPTVNLPRLAKGGFVDSPTTALIGEAGPEVVMPLNRFERLMGIDGSGNVKGGTLNYYAAPNESIDSEAALLQAVLRGRSLGAWSM